MKIIYLLSLSVIFISCREEKKQDPELEAIVRRNTIIIKGSDTELPMVRDLTRAFRDERLDVTFDITGGGSGLGIEALINNETDIANSSREMRPVENLRAKKNGVNPVQVMF
ncbi:MAG: substrate-binding domain-containing protein, partial [Flavitalea sp.]